MKQTLSLKKRMQLKKQYKGVSDSRMQKPCE